jgi:phosphate transport system permease protein
VIFVDRITSLVIRGGGIAVIGAVLGIMIYLFAVVAPLFGGATLRPPAKLAVVAEDAASDPIVARVDEHRTLGIVLETTGRLSRFAAQDDRPLGTEQVFSAEPAILTHKAYDDGRFVLVLADGSIRLGQVDFSESFPSANEVPESIRRLEIGSSAGLDRDVYQRTVRGGFRRVSVRIELGSALPSGSPVPAAVVDYRRTSGGARVCYFRSTADLGILEFVERENMLTGELEMQTLTHRLPLPSDTVTRGPPSALLLTSVGDQLYVAWKDGGALRYDLRDPDEAILAERFDLTPEPHVQLAVLAFVNGEQSLIAGDSQGGVFGWFRVERPGANTDGYAMIRAKTFNPSSAAIVRVAMSARDKSFVVADAAGTISAHQSTAEQQLGSFSLPAGNRVAALQLAPKGDAIFALTDRGLGAMLEFQNEHPGITLSSVLGKVWYEGYPSPTYTWQSSSGTDDFEAKFSLVPLIFGTFKATLYAMLFAIPIAIGAAIYTSEFLDRRTRAVIKPAIEMMAALPSVVLGFLAALILAPWVESAVLAVLTALLGLPVLVLGAGYLWQSLPQRWTLRFEGPPRTIVLLLVVVVGVLALPLAGDILEQLMFRGDFQGWLNGDFGTGAPGLALCSWPLMLIALVLADRRWLDAPTSDLHQRLGHSRAALLELAKYVLIVFASLLLAGVLGSLLAAIGLDPRGLWLGTYVQRNALIVGFTMGFAVIPIIYTISEDALSSVPASLRSASLGCGATRWQTAVRVVLPVAVPGIFSALMVGLGRAVGETMIVLMAAGNTPLIDLNLFNGLRTLSANIAVELPEAVKDSTLYRMLFLAALTLFLLTFVVNTLAELVRIRFRRRAAQL